MFSNSPKLDRVAEDLAELRGQFSEFREHAATRADIGRVEAQLDAMARDGLPHRLTTKQRLSIITSICTAIGAICAAFYALIRQ